jgi:hypothetical protein
MEAKKKIGCGIGTILWGVVIVGGIVLGFIFLMRSCLSQWDTFGTVGWPGVTEDQKSLVIVKSYSKTNSYSRQNGMTSISYSTTYYLEQIELATGKVTKKTKLMSHRKIKKGSLQCYGGYKGKMWIYANFLRAYDMNTLEQVIKIEDIEDKNPQLKGKMPTEDQYFDPHINLGYITITAQDGDKYNLMLDDLHAELVDEKENSFDEFGKNFKKEKDAIDKRIDSLNSAYYASNNYKNYDAMSKQREIFYDIRDSLRRVEENAEELFETQKDLKHDLEEFDSWFSSDIDDWTINKDSIGGYAYILDKDEPKGDNFDLSNFNSMGSESDKVKLYKRKIEANKDSHSKYDQLIITSTEEATNERYLQGAFLKNFKTARAHQLKNPGGYIIFSRDIIGNKGKLLITRIDLDGKKLWQTDALMSFKVSFAMATDSYLIICGVIDKDKAPSFSGSDALRIVDLKTGALVTVKF